MSNALFTIEPYRHNTLWVFDDPDKGIEKEPFIAGADTLIDYAVAHLSDAEDGFILLFSGYPFPGHEYRFDREHPEGGGYWYYSDEFGITGWLCPALFHYFDAAPEHIYAQFRPR